LVRNVNNADMPGYYAACDVFSLPSLNEAFGIVYIEAMACNKPVVATDDPSRREIIGQAGLLCDVTNANEYAQTLQQALSRDWGTLPTQQAQPYSWQQVSAQFAHAIQSVIKS
jgi:glycosyltransferase involved in cell wall biosynthesis